MITTHFYAQDAQGNILPGADVFVYLTGTATLATGLQTALGAALANPFKASATGQIQFKAPDGNYDIRVKSGPRESTLLGVQSFDSVLKFADLASPGGSVDVGYDSGSVQDVLDGAKSLAGYAALRAYSGRATGVRITAQGTSGFFARAAEGTFGADNNGTTIVDAENRRWFRLFSGLASASWFMVVADYYLPNGDVNPAPTDTTGQLQNALDFVDGGGDLIIPFGFYAVSDGLFIGSRCNIHWYGEMVLIAPTAGGGMVGAKPGAVDSTIYGMRLNGNNIPQNNGVGVTSNNGFKFIGGHVKNLAHGKTFKGGRALSAQLGTETEGKNTMFFGVTVTNCYQAMDYHGRSTQSASNIIFDCITVDECEILGGGFSQDAIENMPVSGGKCSGIFSNIIAHNVGKNITYDGRAADTNGIFSFDRCCNASISNVQVSNDPSYGKVGAIFKGKCYNVHASGVTVNGELVAAVDGNTWREADVPGTDAFAVSDSTFDFNCLGPVDHICTPEVGGTGKMMNTIIRGTLNGVTSGLTYHSQMASKPSCYLDVYNRATQGHVKGIFNYLFTIARTFAQVGAGSLVLVGASNNNNGLRTDLGSTGGGVGSGTGFYAVKPDGTLGNMFFHGPGGNNVFYSADDGLHVNGSAWNGRHFIIGAFHDWVDAAGSRRTKNGAPASDVDGVPFVVDVAVPATATSAGVKGQRAADDAYSYTCTATNVWRRVAHASW